jgi:hypothetical protein
MMDIEGVIREASRIERAEHVSVAVKSPVILDGSHRYYIIMCKQTIKEWKPL